MSSLGLSLVVGATAFYAGPARAPEARRTLPAAMGFLDSFFKEMDNFIDDAANRRLGNGAKFYGKRKSSFYGDDDPNRKRDPDVADPEEDWRGPAGGSYFVPSPERDELGRPMGFLTKREARAAAAAAEAAKWEEARKSQDLFDSFADAVRSEQSGSGEGDQGSASEDAMRR